MYDDERLYEIQQKHKHDDRENPMEIFCKKCGELVFSDSDELCDECTEVPREKVE